jgi:hypothetical protein
MAEALPREWSLSPVLMLSMPPPLFEAAMVQH